MPAFAHTPYDGSAKAFSIGLKPLDLQHWIEPDEHFAADLAEKAALLGDARPAVSVAAADTLAAQSEVLDLLVEHLPARFPALYQRDGDTMLIRATGARVSLDGDAPLEAAARLVQEDLVLMRPGPNGHVLAAGVVCFPSSWSLQEHFGHSLDGLHARVPHYPEQLAARMNRIFDNLKPEMPVWRLNWSIYPDGARHYSSPKSVPRAWFGDGGVSAFVRVERQTLRRLKGSGDILFTIKILADPIQGFARHPDGARLAAGLAAEIARLDADQLAYKGLTATRDQMLKALDGLAGEGRA